MKKLFTLLTLLVFLGGGKSWGTDIVWTFSASTIKNGAAFAPKSTNTFIANDGTSELEYKGNSNDDAILPIDGGHDVTVEGDAVNYTSELKLNGGTSSKRYIKLPTISGNGTITVVTGSSCPNRNIYLSKTTDGNDIAIRTSATTYTAYSAEVADLDGEETYYISISGGANIVSIIWSPSTAGPTINAQPLSAGYSKGASATALSISATASEGGGALSYKWYSNSTKSSEGATQVATTATYTPSTSAIGTTYYYCDVTDANGTKTSKFATVCVGTNLARLPYIAKTTETATNSFTIGDFTYAGSGTTTNDGRTGYPTHFKTSAGTVTVSAETNTIRFIKIFGTSNNSSNTASVTAGTGSTIIKGSELVARPAEGDEPVMTEIVIVADAPSAGNSISFTLGKESRLYVEVYCTAENINITPAKDYVTYVSPCALDFSSVDGLEAYVAIDASASSVTLAEVTTVPAGTPLVLKKGSAASYDVPVVASASAPASNLLKAGDGTTLIGGDTKYDYILSDGKFYHASPAGPVAVGKAYLHLDAAPAADGREFLDIDIDGISTGINMVNGEGLKVNGSETYYDLQGRRVLYPTKGLYIVNGKKVIVK